MVTEVTRTGLTGNIGRSLTAAVVGLVLFLGMFVAIFLNEKHYVEKQAALTVAEGQTVAAPTDRVEAANEGRFVLVGAKAATEESLADRMFGFGVAGALKLKRVAEMFQWVEKTRTREIKETGGSTVKETEYYYEDEWSESWNDSSDFKDRSYRNPRMPVRSETWQVGAAELGAYSIGSDVLDRLTNWRDLSFERGFQPPEGWVLAGDHLFSGAGTLTNPDIGDLRVSFQEVPAQEITVVGRQTRDRIATWTGFEGFDLLLVRGGRHDIGQMFAMEQSDLLAMTWGLRIGGIFIMIAALRMVMSPLRAVGDIIPFIGRIVGSVAWLLAAAIAIPLGILAIVISWFAVRPITSLVILAIAVAVSIVLGMLMRGRQRAAAGTPPPMPGAGGPPPLPR